MKAGKVIAIAALALGAAYVLGYDPLGLFRALSDALTPAEERLRAAVEGITRAQGRAADPTRSTGAGVSGAVGIAGGVASAAAGAGIATGAALALTAGIAAGAAILVWGIVKRGWFRGGEEALLVNPARDEVIDVTATIPFAHIEVPGFRTWPQVRAIMKDGRQVADLGGSGIPRSEWSQLRYESMVKALAAAGVHGEAASSVIGQLYAADNMREFEPAAYRYVEALAAGARAQGLAA
jgi:hypothetical protein